MKLRLLSMTLGALLATGAVLPPAASAADTGSNSALLVATGTTLEDFFAAIINNSPELRIARERWNIGTARKDQSTGQLLPQVNANANYSDNERTTTGEPRTSYTGERYGVGVSQVLFNWQAFQARKQASLLENQSEAQYFATLSLLLADVADQYLQVLQAEDALRSVNSELEAMNNQVNQIQSLYDLQLARITDLYEAQARLAAIQADKVTLESEVTIRRESLRAASGIDVGALRRLPDTIEIPPLDGALEEWLARARDNNKELEASEYALQAAEKQVSAVRGVQLPRVSLVYQYQSSDVGYDNTHQNKTDTNYVGVDFSVPLFTGGSNRARVREAYSMRNIAESELQRARMDLLNNTRIAFFQVRSGESRIRAAQVLADSTSTSHEAMQRGFELGTVTTVDVLNALRDEFRAERDLQQARYDHIRAQLPLRREAGSLSGDDLMEISAMMDAPSR
ncbi:MAG TPA: TolC family outer membrane protein [Hyphomicrobiales bacterium]|nr:TolC family outer membrane protein [Hyphomicrobiales bacterium]